MLADFCSEDNGKPLSYGNWGRARDLLGDKLEELSRMHDSLDEQDLQC